MRRLGMLVALGLMLAGCVPVATAPVPGPVVVTPQPAALASEPRSTRTVARDFVTVVQLIEPVAERECRVRSAVRNCDFRILVDDRPGMPANAFQTVDQAGRPIIAVTLALLADTRNADEIAFVLSHEAAHHIAGHLERQRRNATVGAAVFGELAGALGGGTADGIRTAQELGAIVGARSYSKDFELEADRLGTIIAARAGFDPVRGADFFFRIPDPGDQFLGTHPPNADRVAMVRRTAAGQ